MDLTPRSDALDVGGACEVIAVVGFVVPSPLTGGFAGLAACGCGTVALAPDAARVRRKEGLTVLTLAFGAWTSHWPTSPQANERKIVAWKEEKVRKKRVEEARRRRKKGINITLGKEDGTASTTIST